MGDTFVTVIKVLASLSALYMCLSPSTAMLRIHKQRSTGLSSIVPLVALWGCNHMWLLYGYVTDNIFPLMITYLVGDITSVVFITVYYRYTADKQFARKVCVGVFLINAIVTVYAVLGRTGTLHQPTDDVELIVGIIAIASSILLYASPFATIKHVITSKSSESIPFTMVLVGIVNNALWIVYGFLIHDMLLVIPTLVNIGIGFIQFVLYFVYHPKRQKPGAHVVPGAAGAIEIVTETAPRLTLQPAMPVAVEASGVQVDDAHLTKTGVTQSDEVTLSAIHVDSEASYYVEVTTPGRAHTLPSSSALADDRIDA